jgi:hypothetical protein
MQRPLLLSISDGQETGPAGRSNIIDDGQVPTKVISSLIGQSISCTFSAGLATAVAVGLLLIAFDVAGSIKIQTG